MDVLPALMGEQQYQRKGGEEHESSQLKVLTAVKKVVPCPKMLGKGRCQERNRGQRQKEAAEPN